MLNAAIRFKGFVALKKQIITMRMAMNYKQEEDCTFTKSASPLKTVDCDAAPAIHTPTLTA